jgi:polyphosphate kinase
MEDTVKVRIQRKDGTYAKIDKRGKAQIQSQMIFWEKAKNAIEQLQKMDG